MRYTLTTLAILALYILTATPASAVPIFLGPTPYLSPANIPTGFYAGVPTIETLEDGSLDFGIVGTGGSILAPGGFTDSVDIDDGVINGVGAGYSWYSSNGTAGVMFTFNSSPLPTAAGLVWTDGLGNVTFEAFGPGMVSLGVLTPVSVPVGSHTGSTAEDRFYGVQFGGGIQAIKITDTGGGIEVDHIQFGFSPALPEPSTLLLGLTGLAFRGLRRSRRARVDGPSC